MTSKGPFQLIDSDEDSSSSDNCGCTAIDNKEIEIRHYNCKNYECCLNIVAALDWDGFTCYGCNGQYNQQLLWRAQGECNKDVVVQKICELPDLKQNKIETPPQIQAANLKLVVNKK